MNFWNRVTTVIAAILVTVAVITGVFGGPLVDAVRRPISFLTALPAASRLLPSLIFAVAGGLYFYDRSSDENSLLGTDKTPPEQPQNAPELVGDEFEQTLEDALTDIRLERQADTDTEAYRQLRTAAKQGLQYRGGHTPEEAADMLDSGAWTTDPVAQAFLSSDIDYPFRHRVLQWMRPEQSFEQAFRRTTRVVYSLVTSRETVPVTGVARSSWTEQLADTVRSNGAATTEAEQPTGTATTAGSDVESTDNQNTASIK